jgi:large subunit ribosomal protein L25
MYHRGEESVAVALGLKEFTALAKQAKPSQVFTLKSESSKLDGRPVLVRDIARDSVKGQVLHVDLQAMREDEEVTLAIPVRLSGEAPGVKIDKGILSWMVHEMSVSCLPKSIPSEIVVDVTKLGLGQSIHARDIVLPEGVTLVDEPEETIVTVVAAGAEAGESGKPS